VAFKDQALTTQPEIQNRKSPRTGPRDERANSSRPLTGTLRQSTMEHMILNFFRGVQRLLHYAVWYVRYRVAAG
jgi:hypothetical protein